MKLAIATILALSGHAFAADTTTKPAPTVIEKPAERPWCIIPPLIEPPVKQPRTVLPPPPNPFILQPLDLGDDE